MLKNSKRETKISPQRKANAPQEGQERKDAEQPNSAEELPGVEEAPADQNQTGRMMWLVEKVTSLQKESEEKERRIQELEAQTALLLRASQENAEKQTAVERAFREIAQLVQGQATFNESTQRSIACLEKQVKIHLDNIHEVVRILQVHEQHIVNTGAVTQGIALNAVELSKDNEKNRMWIGEMMRERESGSSTSPPAA